MFGSVIAGPAPLASAPVAAREAALQAPAHERFRAAETLILLGDGAGATAVLGRGPEGARSEPRFLRLEIDAAALVYDEARMRAAAARLRIHQDWTVTAELAEIRAARVRVRRLVERVGLGLFALGLAVLGLNGSRALLAVRWSSAMMIGTTIISVGLVASATPRLTPVAAVLGAGFTTLTHAAAATVDRTRPDPRRRLLVVVVLLLSAVGLVMAVLARFSPAQLLAAMSGAGG